MKKIAKILIVSAICACSASTETRDSEPAGLTSKPSMDDIVGIWSNISMTVTFIDTDSIYDVPKGQWEEILKIKPIKTTYREDSTFTSEYVKLDGSPLFTTNGKWYLKNDSLYLEVDGTLTSYMFTFENNIGRFVGLLDWNGDGNRKELYDGKQQKL